MSTSQPNYIHVLKKDCPTCAMVEPVITDLQAGGRCVQIWSHDDPDFPATGTEIGYDRSLQQSWQLDIETVPTFIRMDNDTNCERSVGWGRGLNGCACSNWISWTQICRHFVPVAVREVSSRVYLKSWRLIWRHFFAGPAQFSYF